jgi:hypothetical protein
MDGRERPPLGTIAFKIHYAPLQAYKTLDGKINCLNEVLRPVFGVQKAEKDSISMCYVGPTP